MALLALPLSAQTPKINTLFPIGGRTGTTVEVEVRGSGLTGADKLFVSGRGVSGTVQPGGEKPDEKFKPLFQSKCSGCHELRSPANRSLTPAQWAATVDRMVRVRNAPLSAGESANVTQYLQSMARAGRLTARVDIAPDALPGMVEVRVATPRGVSTACLFEIGSLAEVIGQNGTAETAQPVKLPCVANGTLAGNAERHYYRFTAKKGDKLVFNLKGYRFDDRTQLFFNPDLRLYDSAGKEIAENHGYYDLDPLLDWTCPADGDYTIEVRDLLGRGNPGSVYRLAMGPIPYDTFAFPPAVQRKTKATLSIRGAGMKDPLMCSVDAPDLEGFTSVSTPFGAQKVYVSPYPVTRSDDAKKIVAVPGAFCGRLEKSGTADSYAIKANGPTEFEVFASRLGAPGNPVVKLIDGKGKQVAKQTGDGRMTATLDPAGAYTLQVESADGRYGPEYLYCVEARPPRPGLACVARPDTLLVRHGTTTAVEVQVTRRDGVEGDIQVSAEGLPAGVTAQPVALQPDGQSAWLQITAAPDAATGELPIRIIATAHGPTGESTVTATPQEMYLMNNSPRYFDRAECVLSVRGEPEFTAELGAPGSLKVHQSKAVPLTVRVKRRGNFKGPIIIRVEGLPSGWTASPETIAPNKDEVTLHVRPDGNNRAPFFNRDPKLTPITAVIQAVSDDCPTVVGTLVIQKPDRISDDKDDGG